MGSDAKMAEADFILLDSVDSTNTYARSHFDELSDGCVVAAVEQFAGRGRLGRRWESGRGLSVTASAVLKKVAQPFHAGAVVGLAGLELVRECVPREFAFLKWPNDIYIDDCKVSGILSEGVIASGQLRGVVSGIGINVNNDLRHLRDSGVRAVSLREVSGAPFFVEKLRRELANKIRKYYIMYQFDLARLLAKWREENRLIGETLVLDLPSGASRRGEFCAITESGEMLLRDADGRMFRFDCGDVKIDAALIDFERLKRNFINIKREV